MVGTVTRTGGIWDINCYKPKILLVSLGNPWCQRRMKRGRFLKLWKHILVFLKKQERKVNTTLYCSVDSPSHLNSFKLWTRPPSNVVTWCSINFITVNILDDGKVRKDNKFGEKLAFLFLSALANIGEHTCLYNLEKCVVITEICSNRETKYRYLSDQVYSYMLDIASNISLLPHTHYLCNSFMEQYSENNTFFIIRIFCILKSVLNLHSRLPVTPRTCSSYQVFKDVAANTNERYYCHNSEDNIL